MVDGSNQAKCYMSGSVLDINEAAFADHIAWRQDKVRRYEHTFSLGCLANDSNMPRSCIVVLRKVVGRKVVGLTGLPSKLQGQAAHEGRVAELWRARALGVQ